MKYLTSLFICISILTINLSAQNHPSNEIILSATKFIMDNDFKENELHDYVRFSERPIKYINCNFSGLDRKECLVICPMSRMTGSACSSQDFIMLFYLNKSNEWMRANFHVIEQEIDTMDLDNDKLPELICKTECLWMGESEISMNIFQVKGDVVNNIYSNSGHISPPNYLKVKDESFKRYEIVFKDLDNDNIKEIEENITIGIVKSISKDYEVKTIDNKSKKILKLSNQKYQ